MAPPDRILLAAMATEAGALRGELDDVAGRLGAWMRDLPPGLADGVVTEVQGFDSMGQRLEVLTRLLEGIAGGKAAADLVAAVPLADMAARLGGKEPAPAVAAGDFVLFD